MKTRNVNSRISNSIGSIWVIKWQTGTLWILTFVCSESQSPLDSRNATRKSVSQISRIRNSRSNGKWPFWFNSNCLNRNGDSEVEFLVLPVATVYVHFPNLGDGTGSHLDGYQNIIVGQMLYDLIVLHESFFYLTKIGKDWIRWPFFSVYSGWDREKRGKRNNGHWPRELFAFVFRKMECDRGDDDQVRRWRGIIVMFSTAVYSLWKYFLPLSFFVEKTNRKKKEFWRNSPTWSNEGPLCAVHLSVAR